MTAIHSNKPSKNPFVVAMALGAGLFLLLQLVANRLLSRQEKSALSFLSSTGGGDRSMLPAAAAAASSHNNKVQKMAFEMPIDLFNDEFFASPLMIDSGLLSFKRDVEEQMKQVLGGPSMLRRADKTTSLWQGFDIQEDDEKVTVTVTVPENITKDDITIEVIDGTVMHIAGVRKEEHDGQVSELKFEKRFALGRNMEQDKIQAQLKDGVLTVTTPKAGKLQKNKEVRKIPIKVEL